jgi:hypothetical protein
MIESVIVAHLAGQPSGLANDRHEVMGRFLITCLDISLSRLHHQAVIFQSSIRPGKRPITLQAIRPSDPSTSDESNRFPDGTADRSLFSREVGIPMESMVDNCGCAPTEHLNRSDRFARHSDNSRESAEDD